jgi:hypothetical protein
MTVRELIAELRALPNQDAQATGHAPGNGPRSSSALTAGFKSTRTKANPETASRTEIGSERPAGPGKTHALRTLHPGAKPRRPWQNAHAADPAAWPILLFL